MSAAPDKFRKVPLLVNDPLFVMVPLLKLVPEPRVRLFPPLTISEFPVAKVRLSIVSFRMSMETVELGAPIVTL